MLCGCSFHFVLLLRGRARVVHCSSLKKISSPRRATLEKRKKAAVVAAGVCAYYRVLWVSARV